MLASGLAAAAMPRVALAAEKRVFRARIALEDDRVLIAVGIASKGPFIFMIDTGGAVSLINDALAKDLKLQQIGHSALGGAGGEDIYPLYKARDFVIGGVVRQAAVALVGTRNLRFGDDIVGVLAAGIVTVMDADLDFDASEMRMYPDGRGERASYTAVPSSIRRLGGGAGEESPYIFADVAVNGRRLDTMLDTGQPRFLSVGPSAARSSGLWDDTRPFAPYRPSGLGGKGQLGRIVRASSVQFGGVTIDRPLVALRGQGSGITAGAEIGDAIGGLDLIRRFNLSIDAGARKLWVRPSQQRPADQRYGMSGIWCDRDGDTISVVSVGIGSPAAEAGVRIGDRIVELEWTKMLTMFGSDAGTKLPLTLERDGARRGVELTLRPYL